MIAGSPPIVPKAPDGLLRVIVIGYLASVADYLDSVHDGGIEIRAYHATEAGRRSQVLREILTVVQSGDIDLVVASGARLIARNPMNQVRFVQEVCRNGARVVVLEGGIDTARESWAVQWQIASLRTPA